MGKSSITIFLNSDINVVLVWLGHGVLSSVFWRLVLAGSIGAAITILIVGYTANHFDLIAKKIVRIILMSQKVCHIYS
jgi:hypothetical protein